MTAHQYTTLTRPVDIRRVIRDGQRQSGERVTVHVLAADGETRAGFVCSRGVGGAVVRNRALRLMREAWRALTPRASGGTWIMMVARSQIVGASLGDVIEDVEPILVGARVIE
jgi:ribonuclease P protein component